MNSNFSQPDETTPLIKGDGDAQNAYPTRPEDVVTHGCWANSSFGWVKEELVAVVKLAFPSTLTQVFWMLNQIVTMMFVGHIEKSEIALDVASLSLSFVNVTGNAFACGVATAADTLCAQSYGYQNYKKVGHVFQRGVMILMAATLFIWCIWLNGESLLLLLQQDPCVSKLSGRFIIYYSLSLPSFLVYQMLEKYLNAQNIVWPFVFGGILSNLLSVGLNATFIYAAGLGLNGAAIALVLTNFSRPLFVIVYTWSSKIYRKTWAGWSWESLKGWGQFLKLGIPGAMMLFIEWVSYDASYFVLGSIDVVELALGSILCQLLTLVFMIAFGISTAAAVRVGNELGAGNPIRAKRAAYLSIAISGCTALVTMALLEAGQNVIGRMFTSDKELLEKIPQLLRVLSFLTITDQLQITCSGVLRGSGRQLVGAIGNFVAFYVFGLPMGIFLVLYMHMGALGMWIGLGTASFLQFVVFAPAVFFTNWEKEAIKAVKRVSDDENIEQQRPPLLRSSSYTRGACSSLTHRRSSSINSQASADFEQSNSICEEIESDKEESPPVFDERLPHTSARCRSNLKLLLSKGSVYVVGIVLLVAAGIASQYHPPDSIISGNFSQCST